jgi:hypothetical protein
MSPNNSPTRHRDRAQYMVEYRQKFGSGRDYTLVDCFCGKQVYKYELSRHLTGDKHPPAPDSDNVRLAQERKEAEERQQLFDQIRAQRDGIINQLNSRVFIDAGEAASEPDLIGRALSIFNAMGHRDSTDHEWRVWAQEIHSGISSYYASGQGMRLYTKHIRSMEQDHSYRRRIERVRRRSRKRRLQTAESPIKRRHVTLPVELRRFLGDVDYEA